MVRQPGFAAFFCRFLARSGLFQPLFQAFHAPRMQFGRLSNLSARFVVLLWLLAAAEAVERRQELVRRQISGSEVTAASDVTSTQAVQVRSALHCLLRTGDQLHLELLRLAKTVCHATNARAPRVTTSRSLSLRALLVGRCEFLGPASSIAPT